MHSIKTNNNKTLLGLKLNSVFPSIDEIKASSTLCDDLVSNNDNSKSNMNTNFSHEMSFFETLYMAIHINKKHYSKFIGRLIQYLSIAKIFQKSISLNNTLNNAVFISNASDDDFIEFISSEFPHMEATSEEIKNISLINVCLIADKENNTISLVKLEELEINIEEFINSLKSQKFLDFRFIVDSEHKDRVGKII